MERGKLEQYYKDRTRMCSTDRDGGGTIAMLNPHDVHYVLDAIGLSPYLIVVAKNIRHILNVDCNKTNTCYIHIHHIIVLCQFPLILLTTLDSC